METGDPEYRHYPIDRLYSASDNSSVDVQKEGSLWFANWYEIEKACAGSAD